jgi:hypothetical protein
MAWNEADAWMVDYLVRVHHFDPRREDMRIDDDHYPQGDAKYGSKSRRKREEIKDRILFYL